MFNLHPVNVGAIWKKALEDVGLGERDEATIKRVYKRHMHTLRKFFRQNLPKPTREGQEWLDKQIIEEFLEHQTELDRAYYRHSFEELAGYYKTYMKNLTIFGERKGILGMLSEEYIE